MFCTVMIGVDGGAAGRDALTLARRLAPDGQFVLAHVYGESGAPAHLAEPASAHAGARARSLLLGARRAGAPQATTLVTHDASPERGLRRIVGRRSPDLLVIGSSHRAALGRVLLLGSAIGELDGARCPVAVAPRGYAFAARALRVIGIVDDGGPAAEAALTTARRLAQPDGARVRVLRVDHDHPSFIEGDTTPAGAVASLTAEVDLLVIGSGAPAAPGQVRCGDAVSSLVRSSRCPLLVLPRATAPRPSPRRRRQALAPFGGTATVGGP